MYYPDYIEEKDTSKTYSFSIYQDNHSRGNQVTSICIYESENYEKTKNQYCELVRGARVYESYNLIQKEIERNTGRKSIIALERSNIDYKELQKYLKAKQYDKL